MIPLGIFARTIHRKTVLEVFQSLKSCGFETTHFNLSCVGLTPMPNMIPEHIIEDVKMAMQKTNLNICGVSGTFNMCHPDPGVREKGIKRLKILVDFCKEIEINLISLCTGTRDPVNKWKYHPDNNSKVAWYDMMKCMEQAMKLAEEYQVILAIEPELANIVSSVHKAEKLIATFKSDYLGIIIDPANLYEVANVEKVKYLIDEAVDLLGSRIVMAHAKDKTLRGDFTAPGKGNVPFKYFINQLNKADIEVPLVAHGFAEEDVAFVSHYLKNILQ